MARDPEDPFPSMAAFAGAPDAHRKGRRPAEVVPSVVREDATTEEYAPRSLPRGRRQAPVEPYDPVGREVRRLAERESDGRLVARVVALARDLERHARLDQVWRSVPFALLGVGISILLGTLIYPTLDDDYGTSYDEVPSKGEEIARRDGLDYSYGAYGVFRSRGREDKDTATSRERAEDEPRAFRSSREDSMYRYNSRPQELTVPAVIGLSAAMISGLIRIIRRLRDRLDRRREEQIETIAREHPGTLRDVASLRDRDTARHHAPALARSYGPVAPMVRVSKPTIATLALFLGPTGLHKFLTGRTTAGLCTVLLTLTFLGAFVTFTLGCIECILYSRRSPEDYLERYVLRMQDVF